MSNFRGTSGEYYNFTYEITAVLFDHTFLFVREVCLQRLFE